MITIMIIIMLMIMIMIMAIPMGIVMIMITITILERNKYAFSCWGQFLESPDNQRAPKSCLLFIFKIAVSIVFKVTRNKTIS